MVSGPETICTYKQIADSFKMPYGTIARVIKDFIDNGDVVITRSRGRRAPPVPQEVQRALLDPELLQRWGQYSIKDRLVLCRRELGHPITEHQLRKLYGYNRVRYMTTHWVHRRATLDKERLDAQRREFAKTLGSVITSGLGPIYFGCYFFHSKSHVDINSFRRKRVSGSMIPSLTSL